MTEERERRRIAQELHDHLAQLLVVSRMKLSHAIRQAANTSMSGLLHDLDHVIDESLKYTRSLVAQLTPRSSMNSDCCRPSTGSRHGWINRA